MAEHIDIRAMTAEVPSRVASENRSTPSVAPAPSGGSLSGDVEELERQRILEALEKTAGNQTRAAELLGISRKVLIVRLTRYGFARPKRKS